jgi:integrase/recombinase XerC/integrase/recombinase XerD
LSKVQQQLGPARIATTTISTKLANRERRSLEAHPGDLVGPAQLMGHSDLNTTAVYTQPTAEDLAARVERLPLNACE